jgi:hypothetical protein
MKIMFFIGLPVKSISRTWSRSHEVPGQTLGIDSAASFSRSPDRHLTVGLGTPPALRRTDWLSMTAQGGAGVVCVEHGR